MSKAEEVPTHHEEDESRMIFQEVAAYIANVLAMSYQMMRNESSDAATEMLQSIKTVACELVRATIVTNALQKSGQANKTIRR